MLNSNYPIFLYDNLWHEFNEFQNVFNWLINLNIEGHLFFKDLKKNLNSARTVLSIYGSNVITVA